MSSRLHLDAATPLEEVLDQAGQPQDGSSSGLSLLSSPNVIALGEVGFDCTVGNWEREGKVLDEPFRLADPNKPIILHLRRTAEDKYQRAPLEECIKIAHVAGIPPHQKFHLHCFSGSFKELTHWTQTFPETWFGYTGMVASFDEHQLSGLRSLNAKRFVLETDAPYLWPRPGRRGINRPRLLGEVATVVADARQSTTANVLERTYINARQLYSV
ncbi:putative deoxyribonuclease TATDN2 [Haliotis rubra]|uniref:putative deoxyribonuclease TATDN2 n=1 Tax=Haliotis rubra TaxID=36100 RepID=UPI001EE577F2|nr:putative deoxyribonuclease TATDN2 [Haliotis rubra]